MPFEPFDVVVVPFPFTEAAKAKRRPALVLSAKDFNQDTGHYVLAMITSAKHSAWSSDTGIVDLKSAGLPAPSKVRLKLFTLDERLILQKVGHLAAGDEKKVRKSLKMLLPQ